MRAVLGGLGLLAALSFKIGLFYTNAGSSWYDRYDYAWAGFFGFGVPMVLLGIGVGALWEPDPGRFQIFAWACTVSAIVWAVGLFITVGRWVGLVPIGVSPPDISFWGGMRSFLVFAVPMLVTGVTGVTNLLKT